MKSLWKELLLLACTAIIVLAACNNRVNLYNLQEVSVAANYKYNPHYEELWSDYVNTQRFIDIIDYWSIEKATSEEIAEVLAEDFYDDFVHNYMCFDEE